MPTTNKAYYKGRFNYHAERYDLASADLVVLQGRFPLMATAMARVMLYHLREMHQLAKKLASMQ